LRLRSIKVQGGSKVKQSANREERDITKCNINPIAIGRPRLNMAEQSLLLDTHIVECRSAGRWQHCNIILDVLGVSFGFTMMMRAEGADGFAAAGLACQCYQDILHLSRKFYRIASARRAKRLIVFYFGLSFRPSAAQNL